VSEDNIPSRTQLILGAIRLKLKIYSALGIDMEADSSGTYSKVVVRNVRKGDMNVINIDPKLSRFFYSNYIWQSMQ